MGTAHPLPALPCCTLSEKHAVKSGSAIGPFQILGLPVGYFQHLAAHGTRCLMSGQLERAQLLGRAALPTSSQQEPWGLRRSTF